MALRQLVQMLLQQLLATEVMDYQYPGCLVHMEHLDRLPVDGLLAAEVGLEPQPEQEAPVAPVVVLMVLPPILRATLLLPTPVGVGVGVEFLQIRI